MSKMDDMIKIKIVKTPQARRPLLAIEERETREEKGEYTPPTREIFNKQKNSKKSPRYLLWFVALFSVIFLFFSLSYTFSSAVVSITPKTEEVKIKESFLSSKDPTSAIPFDLIVMEGEETEKIKAIEKKVLEVPSKGVAIIYNSFSPAPQTLNIDTRLEGSNGKMYKTEKRITVPGMKNGQPGKTEVSIYAAIPGSESDSEPLDFKIFGFKGSNKYEKIYARSKGVLSGGVKGEFYVVSPEEKAKILTELKKDLENKLYKKATDQIPEGFVLFKDAVFLSINETSEVQAYSKESSVPVILKGTLYGFLFEETKLAKKLAEDVIPKYDGTEVYVHNLKDLAFTLANKDTITFAEVKDISFTLSGSSKIVWKFDDAKFTKDLLGKSKKDFNLALSKYPNVASANLMLRPFWRMSFPSKEKDINITVNYPK